MASDNFPESFKDPTYAALDAGNEQKYDLPKGLLAAIRTRGERSNNSDVSDANAKGVYQFIPATKRAILDKYGIDVSLSPQNASEGAALLLKEGLDRNGGDPALAVAEYTGGLDRSKWGPITKSYVQRVVGRLPTPDGGDTSSSATGANPAAATPNASAPSTFDRVSAQLAKPTESSMANVYAAYQSGQMSPTDAAQYESDVKAGHIMLPHGASLKTASPPPDATGAAPPGTLPNSVVQAYVDGSMSDKERAELESDVRTGAVKMPAGLSLGKPSQPDTGVGNIPLPIVGNVGGLEGAAAMGTGLVAAPVAGIAGLGAAATNALGLTNTEPADVVRSVAGAMTYSPRTPQGQADLAAGNFLPEKLAQLGDAAGEKAANLTGSPAIGAGVNAAIQVGAPALLGKVGGGVVGAVRGLREAPSPLTLATEGAAPVADAAPAGAAVPPSAPPEVPAATPASAPIAPPAASIPVAPVAAAAETPAMGAVDLAATARKAADGSKSASQILADQAAPSPVIKASAERLGIGDYLQPDHMTTNEAYRQVVGTIKSNPQSAVALAEKEGLAKVAQRASDLIDDIGGTNDLSALDQSVKTRMQATHAEMMTKEDALYDKIRAEMPARTAAPATNVLDFIKKRADDLGGEENLTPLEKNVVQKLAPKGPDPLAGLGERARAQAEAQGVRGPTQPTYGLLDDVRKDIGSATQARGAFKDADSGLAKQLYAQISKDQEAVVTQAGLGDTFTAAKGATVLRKGFEDDLASLFGKNLDRSFVGGGDVGLPGAMKSAAAGDATKFVRLIQAVPENMRQGVAASGLGTIFRKAATRGEMDFTGYAKWMDGLQRNRQAYAALMSNLPLAARKQLMALYHVSKGISESLATRTKTGALATIKAEMMGSDTLMSNLYGLAKRVGVRAVASELGTSAIGMPGVGLASALSGALAKGRPPPLAAVDALLASAKFEALVKSKPGSTARADAIRVVAMSPEFSKVLRKTDHPLSIAARERWLAQSLAAGGASTSSSSKTLH